MPPRPRLGALLAALLFVISARARAADCRGVPGPLVVSCLRTITALQAYQNASPEDKQAAREGFEKDRTEFLAAIDAYQADPNHAMSTDIDTNSGMTLPGQIGPADRGDRTKMAPGGDALSSITAAARKLVQSLDLEADAIAANGSAPGDAAGDGGKTLKTQVMPKNVPPAQRQAQDAINGGQPGAAEKTLDQAIKNDPNDAAAVELRARARLAQGNREGAIADARRALELNPNDHEARAFLSELEGLDRAANRFKSAKVDFGQSPDGGGPGGPDGRARGGTGGPAGPESRRAGTFPGGAGAAAAPEAPVPPALRSLFQTARERLGIGDTTGGLLALRQIVDLDPGRTDAWEQIAEASNEAKNYAGALRAADEALKLNPNDARALRAKAYAELQLGDLTHALADIERAVGLEPQNAMGYLYRAMIEEKLGETAKAIQDYKTAARLDATLIPNAEEALKRLGAGTPPAGAQGRTSRYWFRGGAIAASTLLIVLGLMGTATGRSITSRARGLLTGRRAEAAWASSDERRPGTVEVGALIGGHYRVTRELGRGGMGVVYLATDETLRRPVAIKQMQSEFRADPLELERFLKEARLVAQLKHPNIAEIHSVVSDGDLLLVFEYVDGQPLDRLVSPGKRMTPDAARRVLGQIGSALEYAHQRKIVHRDLKPSNVMLAGDGTVKVMDFGIAHQSASGATHTKTSVSGTPPYMSPEQCMGSVSKASDLYALGVMAYEMLAGARPFEGPDFLEAKLERRYAPATSRNPALPARLDEFFARALDPDPTKRPADAAEFIRALGAALDATPSRV